MTKTTEEDKLFTEEFEDLTGKKIGSLTDDDIKDMLELKEEFLVLQDSFKFLNHPSGDRLYRTLNHLNYGKGYQGNLRLYLFREPTRHFSFLSYDQIKKLQAKGCIFIVNTSAYTNRIDKLGVGNMPVPIIIVSATKDLDAIYVNKKFSETLNRDLSATPPALAIRDSVMGDKNLMLFGCSPDTIAVVSDIQRGLVTFIAKASAFTSNDKVILTQYDRLLIGDYIEYKLEVLLGSLETYSPTDIKVIQIDSIGKYRLSKPLQDIPTENAKQRLNRFMKPIG